MEAILHFNTGVLTIKEEKVSLPSLDSVIEYCKTYLGSKEYEDLARKFNLYSPGIISAEACCLAYINGQKHYITL